MPVVGVTKRIDGGVDDVGECLMDDVRFLFRLSGFVSAESKMHSFIDFMLNKKTRTFIQSENFFTIETGLVIFDIDIVGKIVLGC